LTLTNSTPMPSHLFHPLPPVGFKKGMHIEAVDKVVSTEIEYSAVTSPPLRENNK
jgi:hypothetical protein